MATKKTKPPKLGNVNATVRCRLLKDGVKIGHCMFTPNAVAYSFNKTGATLAISTLGKIMAMKIANEDTYENGWHHMGQDRIKNKGYLKTDKQAMLTRLSQKEIDAQMLF